MFGGYTMIASILLYFLILRSLDSRSMTPVKAAAMLIGISVLLTASVGMLENASRGLGLLHNIVTIQRGAIAILQFIIAVFIFNKADQVGDEYMSFVFWGGLGLALLFFIAPSIVNGLLLLFA